MMASRRALVAANSKSADEIMLNRFGAFIMEPHTDEKAEFKLDAIEAQSGDEALVDFYKHKKQICGLYIIAFVRVLRPVKKGADNKPLYQDIIIRTINKSTRVSDELQFKLYSYASFKSKFSVLLNALRRHNLSEAQKVIIQCNNASTDSIPEWAQSPMDFNVWKNGHYGEVEKNYRIISEYLFVHKNSAGTKVSQYLPSGLFMRAFRKLEDTYLTDDRTPRQLLKYILIRIIAIYPGRSGAEMRQWARSCVMIREVWLKLMIPKGWKNTKSGNKIKPFVKIGNSDPLYKAVVDFFAESPDGLKCAATNAKDEIPLFVRPKKAYKVTSSSFPIISNYTSVHIVSSNKTL